MRALAISAGALAVLGLAACQSTSVDRVNYQASYSPGDVGLAAAGGSMPVAVYGQPFAGAKLASDEAVAAAAKLPGSFGDVPLRPVAGNVKDGGRIVLVFDAAPNADGAGACRDPQAEVGRPATDGRLRLQAAFCYGADLQSEASMSLPKPTGPHDPAFGQSLGSLLVQLLPTQNQHQIKGKTSTTLLPG